MKINNKGFMLAEVVVVSVVVTTVLVTLFTGLNNVSSAYETRNRYYDVDSLYVAMEINEILKRDNISLEDIDTASYIDNIEDIESYFLFKNFYFYDVGDNIVSYFTPYDNDKMLSLKNLSSVSTFSDYLDYLSGNLDFDDDYNYMIIVERIENNDYDDRYYYALKLKY